MPDADAEIEPVIELASGPARLTVAPGAGGRMASLRVAEFDLLVEASETNDPLLGWGCFPMAPWPGRVDHGKFSFRRKAFQLERSMPPHAIHGTLWARRWDVEESGPNWCRLSADLAPGWPFGGRVVQHIELDPNAVAATLEVHADKKAMPAACGWHPWWRRDLSAGGPLELDGELGLRWERDRDLPTGKLVPAGDRPPQGWDDCFTDFERSPVLRWPGALEMTLETDCQHLVVYDQPIAAICVEPQTAPPNAFNLRKAAVVEPGQPLVAHARWSWMLG